MSGKPRSQDNQVVLGKISGLYGVRGWIKVHSYTDPRENIVSYSPWLLERDGKWQAFELLEGRRHGKSVVAQLEGLTDRDAAAELVGATIAIRRDQLGPPQAGEYYWADLQGLRVITSGGVELGAVDYLIETGANDVLVVKGDRERLIPFVREQVVKDIDLDSGVIRVDWDPEF